EPMSGSRFSCAPAWAPANSRVRAAASRNERIRPLYRNGGFNIGWSMTPGKPAGVNPPLISLGRIVMGWKIPAMAPTLWTTASPPRFPEPRLEQSPVPCPAADHPLHERDLRLLRGGQELPQGSGPGVERGAHRPGPGRTRAHGGAH